MSVPRPVSCDAFPEASQYTDAGGLTTSPAWKVIGEIAAKAPGLLEGSDDASLERLYRTVLFRQVLDALRFLRRNRSTPGTASWARAQ